MPFLLAFAAMIVRNAWLSDDAYITFRTVDNVVNGYGLTWNVAERVQVYTHPLWMFLLVAARSVTGELFFTSLALSLALSLAAVILVATRLARTPALACLGVMALTLSKAFVDYATSGLENPLTHLLLAAFLLLYLRARFDRRALFWLTLLASLGVLNRQDTLLLYAPALLYALWQVRSWRAVGCVALGALPVVLWELFSLLYYGFPFPNTAYAKLTAGLISRRELVREGLLYLLNALRADGVTLPVTLLGIAVPFVTREWRKVPVSLGLGLYLAYVVYVGGDFMSGRFLTPPLFGAVALLLGSHLAHHRLPQVLVAALVLLAAVTAPYSPLLASGERGARPGDEPGWVRGRSISDERANYYGNTGLLPALRALRARRAGDPFPNHDWALDGRAARAAGPAVVRKGSVGFYGYFAGPEVYVVDVLGLGNALLARLPPSDPQWSIGHFGRLVPEGYRATLESGANRIADPHLARYYDALARVIASDVPLLDPARLRAIWRLNTGAYDDDLTAYAYASGPVFTRRLRVTNPADRPYVYAYLWNHGSGALVQLDDASVAGRVYEIAWHVTREGVRFAGPGQPLATIGPLSDAETLNIGVLFSPTDELSAQDKYEYRYWFRFEPDDTLTVVLPGTGFHNPDVATAFWAPVSIDAVMDMLR